MNDPEMMAAMQNPKVMAALQSCMSNPMAMMQYMNDPEIGPVLQKLMGKMMGGGGAMTCWSDPPAALMSLQGWSDALQGGVVGCQQASRPTQLSGQAGRLRLRCRCVWRHDGCEGLDRGSRRADPRLPG